MNEGQKIVVVGTGGTISSRFDPSQGRVTASEDLEEIAALLPDRNNVPRAGFENFIKISGFEMTVEVAHAVVRHVAELLARPDVGGVVVTQGTDTMEETSFLADLLLPPGKPVVFTGAQLPHDHPQSDGPRNLLDSIRAAAAPDSVGLGVMVCFNGRLHAARDVTKIHTSALETFQSYDHGALGCVDDGLVVVYRRPGFRLTLSPDRLDKRVDLIRLVLGTEGRALDAALADGVDGIVVEAFGRGNANTGFGRSVSRACAAGVPVVITSRCPSGRVQPIYGSGGGGGRDLEDAGAIFAGDLKGPKARLVLIVALSDASARGRLRELFKIVAP